MLQPPSQIVTTGINTSFPQLLALDTQVPQMVKSSTECPSSHSQDKTIIILVAVFASLLAFAFFILIVYNCCHEHHKPKDS